MKRFITVLAFAALALATDPAAMAGEKKKKERAADKDKAGQQAGTTDKDKTGSDNTGTSGTGAGASPQIPGNSTAGSVEAGGNKATGPSKPQTGSGVPGTPSNP